MFSYLWALPAFRVPRFHSGRIAADPYILSMDAGDRAPHLSMCARVAEIGREGKGFGTLGEPQGPRLTLGGRESAFPGGRSGAAREEYGPEENL